MHRAAWERTGSSSNRVVCSVQTYHDNSCVINNEVIFEKLQHILRIHHRQKTSKKYYFQHHNANSICNIEISNWLHFPAWFHFSRNIPRKKASHSDALFLITRTSPFARHLTLLDKKYEHFKNKQKTKKKPLISK